MPKVAYSEAERERIRGELVSVALELMARQGIHHTTVEQIYRAVGISRSFFYTFFPTKEDLIVESLYLQQPRILEYARSLMADPELSWREAVRRFLHSCCYGEQHGIAVLTVEEQQLIFRRLSPRELRRLPREAGAALRRHPRELRHPRGPGADKPLHKPQPDRHDSPPGHTGHAAPLCARGGGRYGRFSDRCHRGPPRLVPAGK